MDFAGEGQRTLEGYLVSPARICLVLLIRTTQTSKWRRAITRRHKTDGLDCKRLSAHTYACDLQSAGL